MLSESNNQKVIRMNEREFFSFANRERWDSVPDSLKLYKRRLGFVFAIQHPTLLEHEHLKRWTTNDYYYVCKHPIK
jgi:hypothetical protein